MKSWIYPILGILVLISCGDKDKVVKKAEEIAFETSVMYQSDEDCMGKPCAEIEINYDSIGNIAFAKEINEVVMKSIFSQVKTYTDKSLLESIDELGAQFIENYNFVKKESHTNDIWNVSIGVETSYISTDKLSLILHTNTLIGEDKDRSTSFLNFDLKTGKQISNVDLYSSELELLNKVKQQLPDSLKIFEKELTLPKIQGYVNDGLLLHYTESEMNGYPAFDLIIPIP